MKLWAGRFQKETNDVVNDFNSSIQFDGRLYREDITGSIAHATMLGKQGIIEEHESEKIVAGLKKILKEVDAGELDVFNPEYEDIHMNVEVALTKRIGDTGKRLHTAALQKRSGRTGYAYVCQEGNLRDYGTGNCLREGAGLPRQRTIWTRLCRAIPICSAHSRPHSVIT